MLSWKRALANAGLEVAYASGLARLAERNAHGCGVILKFEHVRPSHRDPFQPLRSHEITPEFLDRAIEALKRWKFDVLSIDEIAERAQQPIGTERYIALTFDGAYCDFMTFAYPVLSRHRVPFAIYVPTGFVDGIGQAWQLALRDVVAKTTRIALVMDGDEKRFNVSDRASKYELYDVLHAWLLSLPPDDLGVAIGDLCRRYGVDLSSVSKNITMTWQDLAVLARDPLATIGCATVNYPNLRQTKGTAVLREMAMGRKVLETALGMSCRHFAYPYGDRDSFTPRDVMLARESGFATAVSSEAGFIGRDGQPDLMRLPRIAWDGRRTSLRAFRAVLSGITVRREERREVEPAINYG
ncbi:polysaccharide deacetylase family protein [Bradyrhizobium sp. SYSU BS000235]|uniref:polysaccharide deacetylase family protein n=1 Tax=Bradyrhizobium sp. SYSU BS000235 TaxID=3411332 RepID=UPI003C7651C3